MKIDNLGMKVKIKYTKNSPYARETIYRNVTEIHYCFQCKKQTALESDIHGTGCTIQNQYIKEFEAIVETEKANNF